MTRVLNDNRIILDGHKLLWHRERVEAWLRGDRVAPIMVDLALTQACSYKCIYCCGKFQQNKGFNLSRDIIYRFLDDAAEIGVKGISLISDGESTLSPHFYDAVKRGNENGLDVAVGTNGFSLDDKRLEDMLPKLTYIRSFKEIWQSDRYWEVMAYLQSDEFDARRDCGTLCMQHAINEFLWELKLGNFSLEEPTGPPPLHINFV